ncbi:helix-turn-helix domain-containing protein [Nocardia cyriacigeorgica]|uniref:helix-turn-helix domain-containing protein n=1 Tax=Nocardia cyriacigeorgica TaxID=135487 RepID=UPI001892F2BA|nr:helix-turn-helix transcriptional regulator [Nocardia cyriacigeorgica]MBF6342866.1 helix-turn-helix domain-containing protein [Nocardia cyriacigeorgica]MBF6514776.1 helix-turn-helix domain-containing protein [Nocardia cyriacigeorgica]
MTQDLTIGERVAWYRRRRGMSQGVLAGLIGRTEDWMGKVENNRIPLDRLSVIRLLADALDVSLGDVIGEPTLLDWTSDSGTSTVPALRAALMDYGNLVHVLRRSDNEGAPHDVAAVQRELRTVFEAYQASRFGLAAGRLPGLLTAAMAIARTHAENGNRLLALTYQAAASVASKLGETDLAWNAAERGLAAAQRTEDPVIVGSLLRSVAFAVMATGRVRPAVDLVEAGASYLDQHLQAPSEDLLSVYGTLLLVGSMAAARDERRDIVQAFLSEADRAAARLGGDRNRVWTAFGPTNVAIHRVGTAMELGDVQIALRLGPAIDTSALPLERQIRHKLELARALNLAGRQEDSLSAVLTAERAAAEQVRHHYLSRQLVLAWIRNCQGTPPYALQGLARRMRIVRC